MAAARAATGAKEKWLVRTEKNKILGPFSREELRKMIQEGALALQDEVCLGSSYWIYLHEAEEVRQQLDIDVHAYVHAQRASEVDEDAEETETETEILSVGMTPEPSQSPGLDAEIPDWGETVTEETSVMSNRAFRRIRSRKEMGAQSRATDPVADFFQASVKAGPERSSFWRIFAVFLVVLVIALLVSMVWVLKSPPTP